MQLALKVVFVVQPPARGHFYEYVAAALRVEAVAGLVNVFVAAREQLQRCVYVAHARYLGQELLGAYRSFREAHALLLKQVVVKEYLRAEACLDILRGAPQCPEIHVEQVGRAVDVECARRYVVFGVVCVFLVAVARASYDKQHLLCAHPALELPY